MKKIFITTKITILLFVFGSLFSCVDDDYMTTTVNQSDSNVITLQLPPKKVVNINTRSADTQGVDSLLAAVIRPIHPQSSDSIVIFEFVDKIDKPTENNSVSFTLNSLRLKADEKLYVFCNVGKEQKEKKLTGEQQLLSSITCSSGTDVMYGVREKGAANSISLFHSFSNVEVGSDNGYKLDSIIVCDVPKVGFASGLDYVTSDKEDVKFINSVGTMFFVPRPDNDVSDSPTTFLLIKLTGKGWYRLDFYQGGNNLELGNKPELMKIERNYFYHFNISSVKNDGYSSKEEARSNTGSNIVYNLSVDDSNVASSNGQYMLLADKDEILLYPEGSSTLSISALIPDGVAAHISTYTAKVYAGDIKILLEDNSLQDSINLMKDVPLTQENSVRKIKFSATGAWMNDGYLELSLGNIKKKIPFRLLSANSYMFDCLDNHPIKIPFIQAVDYNGNVAIDKTMASQLTCNILWADQPKADFDMHINAQKGWIELKATESGRNFVGNAVIAVKDAAGEIKWSWHIWCMDSQENPISYMDNNGLYEYKDEYIQSYCGKLWMDRNLGAYRNDPVKAGNEGTRGLGYQWGRKDPFSLGGDLQTTPLAENYWPENKNLYTPDKTFLMGDVFPETNIPTTPNKIESHTMSDKDASEYSVKYPFAIMGLYQDGGMRGGACWRKDMHQYAWDKNGRKAPHDPCPIGWKVPTSNNAGGPLYEFTIENASGAIDEKCGLGWNVKNLKGENKIAFYPYAPTRIPHGELLSYSYGYSTDGTFYQINRSIKMAFANPVYQIVVKDLVAAGVTILYGGGYDGIEMGPVKDNYNTHLKSVFEHTLLIDEAEVRQVRCVREK